MDWARPAGLAAEHARSWDADAPGGAIVLFDTEEVRAASCGGLASLEHNIPFTAETPTRFASISKHFAAAALLSENVALNTSLGELLDWLPPAVAAVPLARALDMTGGLPDMMELLWQQGVPFTASVARSEIEGVLRGLPGVCSPAGTEMAYSNTGWRLAQLVIEARGSDYFDVLRRSLLDPLGVRLWFPANEAAPVPGLATGYWRDGPAWQRGRYGMHISASGGLAGSAASLARWVGALMAGRGPLDGMLARLTAPRTFADGTPSAYRLGLVCTALGGTQLVGHGGSLPGYKNHLWFAPAHGVGVAVLSNREEDALSPALRIMAALVGETVPAPAATPTGLFATEAGPFWAELQPGVIEFMGGHETLLAQPGVRFRSVPSALDVDLRVAEGGALEGRIGGVQRRLLPVTEGQPLDPRLVGTWRNPAYGAALQIREDGTAQLPWLGGMGMNTPLIPLPGARAIATLTHTVWRHRPCLWLGPEGALHLASHRCRVLTFVR